MAGHPGWLLGRIITSPCRLQCCASKAGHLGGAPPPPIGQGKVMAREDHNFPLPVAECPHSGMFRCPPPPPPTVATGEDHNSKSAIPSSCVFQASCYELARGGAAQLSTTLSFLVWRLCVLPFSRLRALSMLGNSDGVAT